MLAPEDYIQDGRTEIEIIRYFLFHVGRGSAARPTEMTEVRYQVYRDEKSLVHEAFSPLAGPMRIDVEFSGRGRHRLTTTISFAGTRYAPEIEPTYARYLYLLAWADGLASFRVPFELTVG